MQSNISENDGSDCNEFVTKSDSINKTFLSNVRMLNVLNKSETGSMKILSSSLSDNSFDSSDPSDIECNNTENHEVDLVDQIKSSKQVEIEKAIKKMEKLDRILMGKMKKEREVN